MAFEMYEYECGSAEEVVGMFFSNNTCGRGSELCDSLCFRIYISAAESL